MKKSVAIFALLCILFVFQSALAAEPTAKTGLVFNGEPQQLVSVPTSSNFYWFRDPNDEDNNWVTGDKVLGILPGEYKILWTETNTETPPAKEAQIQEHRLIITIAENNPPKPREGLVYNGGKSYLVKLGTGLQIGDYVYFYRNRYTGEWTESIPEATDPDTYEVEYYLARYDNKPGVDTEGKKFNVTITGSGNSGNNGNNGNTSSHSSRPIYYIGDGTTLFGGQNTLPATGFPTRVRVPLSVKPANINYETLSMRIQIPAINVDVELTGVPEVDGTWAVEWLADQAGLLSGSAMPGEGYAMIAAHNHLNTMEIGPFAMLFSLEENDRIFVNTADDGLQIYSVYANELLEPDDMQKMASIAQSEENSIILVTCENEMIEGGYMNRRAVFAKPQ